MFLKIKRTTVFMFKILTESFYVSCIFFKLNRTKSFTVFSVQQVHFFDKFRFISLIYSADFFFLAKYRLTLFCNEKLWMLIAVF